MYENIIKSVDDFIRYAVSEAFSLKHDYIGTEHILLAFFKVNSRETEALVRAGANYNQLKSYLIDNRGYGTFSNVPTKLSKNAKKVVDKAMDIAVETDSVQVLPVHLLISLLDSKIGYSFEMLEKTGIRASAISTYINEKILNVQSGHPTSDGSGVSDGEFIEKFAVNLNKRAEEGKIDPVVGRDTEIDRILQILLRRTKNNPVLIGEAGVGKTAIAEGLALRIVENKVPDVLSNKEIYSVDLPGMLAGSKYRGDFEKRIKGTLDEIIERKNIIMFIDEFHNIVGTGGSEGSIDAANILKPFLARGEIQLIGATTIDEYRKNIEKDAALERRLQPIDVNEPSIEESIKILEGLRPKYEQHHGISISDDAIKAAVELSNRYLTDRFLPDKAIDLIDEAGSMLRIKSFLKNDDILKIKDENNQLKIKIKDAVSKQDFLKAQELKNKIEENNIEINKLKEIQDLNRKNEKLILGYDDIAKIVSDWSKVPVTKITSNEGEKYLKLADNLKKIVIGQDKATETIANIVVGIIGSFVGGFIVNLAGGEGVTGLNLYSLAVSVLGAVVLLFVFGFFKNK